MELDNALDVKELSNFALDTIQQMGTDALKYYGKGRSLCFDQDLVTQAELHLTELFERKIASHYPDHRIFEANPLDESYSHEAKRYLWIFDPLDGVDNFQSGIPIWGMSLALYENFWPVLGIFFMPATGDIFRAYASDKAYWNDRPIQIADRAEASDESLLLTFSRFNQHYQCRFPGKIRDFGSTGAHICYVAMGRADAALIANESFKDLAAVRVIVEAAGGKIYNKNGEVFLLGDYLDGKRIDAHLLIAAKSNAQFVAGCLTPSIA